MLAKNKKQAPLASFFFFFKIVMKTLDIYRLRKHCLHIFTDYEGIGMFKNE